MPKPILEEIVLQLTKTEIRGYFEIYAGLLILFVFEMCLYQLPFSFIFLCYFSSSSSDHLKTRDLFLPWNNMTLYILILILYGFLKCFFSLSWFVYLFIYCKAIFSLLFYWLDSCNVIWTFRWLYRFLSLK